MTDLEHVSSAPTRPQPAGRAEVRDPFALPPGFSPVGGFGAQ